MLTVMILARRPFARMMIRAAVLCMIGVVGCDQGQSSWSQPSSEKPERPRGLLLSGPSGERWTIECLVDRGPGHTTTIDRLAELLRNTRGIRPDRVRVVHEEDVSTLYYGSYVRKEDPETGQRSFSQEMNRDIQLLRQLAIDPTHRPFAAARRVLETAPDQGPEDWDLRRAKGTYSLQIAVFYNQGAFHGRKKAAVDYCQQWREKGYEAYYFHGATRSSTTVGTFPATAVEDNGGILRYGPAVRTLQGKEPEFDWNLENGHKIYERRNGQRVLQRSVLIKIPREGQGPGYSTR